MAAIVLPVLPLVVMVDKLQLVGVATMNDRAYERARRQVCRLRGLYSHALIYAAVNLGLATFNLVTAPGDIWFIYPLLGWGLGLASHGASVYALPRWFGRDWEARKIRELMQHEERS